MLTMAEYIEREAISEEIRKYYYKNPPNSSYGEGFDRGRDRAQRAILDAPAADVDKVRRGRCKKSDGKDEWYTYYYTCVECGANMMVADSDYHDVSPNYCPNCGAKMDGGNN